MYPGCLLLIANLQSGPESRSSESTGQSCLSWHRLGTKPTAMLMLVKKCRDMRWFFSFLPRISRCTNQNTADWEPDHRQIDLCLWGEHPWQCVNKLKSTRWYVAKSSCVIYFSSTSFYNGYLDIHDSFPISSCNMEKSCNVSHQQALSRVSRMWTPIANPAWSSCHGPSHFARQKLNIGSIQYLTS